MSVETPQTKLLKLINEEWKIKLSSHKPNKPDPTDGVNPKRDKNKLIIGALNIHGLGTIEKGELKSVDKKSVKKLLKDRFDICVLSETWIGPATDDAVLEEIDYTFVRADRRYAKKKDPTEETKPNKKIGGGLLIYLHKTVNYKVRSIYEQNTVQFVHIEITNIGKPLHLVAIYSPSIDHYSHVISIMCQFLAAKSENENIMFIGDFNIDLFGEEIGQKLFQLLLKAINNEPFKMHQLIKGATHKTKTKTKAKAKATCIDHIHTDIPEGDIEARGTFDPGAKDVDVSTDHKGIYCTVKCKMSSASHTAFEDCTFKQSQKLVEFIATLQEDIKVIKEPGKCVFAIFFKFHQGKTPKDISNDVKIFDHSDHVAIWATLESTDDIDSKCSKLEKVVERQNNLHKEQQQQKKKYMQTRPQCTIFTRDYTTDVYQSLRQRMWFKNWDAVWQPCFVDFLGVDLEPTLTCPITAGDPAVSSTASGGEAIALQNSLPWFCICKAKQCHKLFATEEDLIKHEVSNHTRCALCDKVYKETLAKPPKGKNASYIPVCNTCHKKKVYQTRRGKMYCEKLAKESLTKSKTSQK